MERNHFCLFVAAVGGHYIAFMSGIVSLGVAFWERAKGSPVTNTVFWLVGVASLFIAVFGAWNEQFDRAEQIQGQLDRALASTSSQAIDALSRSNTELKTEVANLKSEQWPRLTAAQQTDLEQFLAQGRAPVSKIFTTYSDASGVGLSSDLATVFKALHWPQMQPAGSIDAMGATGIAIIARPDDKAATRLMDGLRRAGFHPVLDSKDYDRSAEYTLVVIVGMRAPY